MKKLLLLVFFASLMGFALPLGAQDNHLAAVTEDDDSNMPDRSVVFAQYDDQVLGMDVYMPDDNSAAHPCMIFTYGGGFKMNTQRNPATRRFCRRLADDLGIVVLAIDYRLGLKDNHATGKLSMARPLKNAIDMGTEDLFKALKCVLDNAFSMRINPARIFLCGSSAGAMISLQADFELCNRTEMTTLIPDDFRFAGVISFAGALFSTSGRPSYVIHSPAPTFLLHGDADKLVPYDKIAVLKYWIAGSNTLAKIFDSNGYVYRIKRYKGLGHSVAMRLEDDYDDVVEFIRSSILGGEKVCYDETVKMLEIPVETAKIDRVDLNYLYNEM